MTDEELANFIFYLLWDDATDGNTPEEEDWDKIKEEFLKRNWEFDYY